MVVVAVELLRNALEVVVELLVLAHRADITRRTDIFLALPNSEIGLVDDFEYSRHARHKPEFAGMRRRNARCHSLAVCERHGLYQPVRIVPVPRFGADS